MEIFNESSQLKEKFRKTANKLLNHCFILKRKPETKEDYFFIHTHKSYFIEYFDLLGFNIKIDESYGVISLESSVNSGRINLKKIESIILLILRLLYIEKSKEIRLEEDVVILIEDVHGKYNALNISSKPTLDKTTIKDCIRLFKKYNLVMNLDREVVNYDSRLKIYPSILFALTNENINKVEIETTERLVKYEKRDADYEQEIDQD